MKPVVVADTSPIVYLHLIQRIEVLPALFGTIHISPIIFSELAHPSAPAKLAQLTSSRPDRLHVEDPGELIDPETEPLDWGERSAIALAQRLNADLVLIDERKGTRVCLRKRFKVTGTLGILDIAARRGLADLKESLERLKATNFRYRPEMLDLLLARFRADR